MPLSSVQLRWGVVGSFWSWPELTLDLVGLGRLAQALEHIYKVVDLPLPPAGILGPNLGGVGHGLAVTSLSVG